MATRSKFERQLNFRQHGFAIKIPDVGVSLKPFDYVVGLPTYVGDKKILRFVAIEAKAAKGWSLSRSGWREHQRKALDVVESLAPFSSWVAVGFLDIPKMKLDHNRQKIIAHRKKEAFLLAWPLFKSLENGGSCSYGDIVDNYPNSALEWAKRGKTYSWAIPPGHAVFCKYP